MNLWTNDNDDAFPFEYNNENVDQTTFEELFITLDKLYKKSPITDGINIELLKQACPNLWMGIRLINMLENRPHS
jgi:hypothetical protein